MAHDIRVVQDAQITLDIQAAQDISAQDIQIAQAIQVAQANPFLSRSASRRHSRSRPAVATPLQRRDRRPSVTS